MRIQQPQPLLAITKTSTYKLCRTARWVIAFFMVQLLTACMGEPDSMSDGTSKSDVASDLTLGSTHKDATAITRMIDASGTADSDNLIIIDSAYKPDSSNTNSLMPSSKHAEFPEYPAAERYRIGGENGLKIVVFETQDSFEQVDAFFNQQAQAYGLTRLTTTLDYVKYTKANEATSTINGGTSGAGALSGFADSIRDDDAWDASMPGIVIHTFLNADDAVGYGASPDSKTNIILSYR